MNLDILTVVIFSYLVGSMPFGLLLTKIFLKKDLRKFGSGNIGATNVLRTGNKILAFLTLSLDLLKGYIIIFFFYALLSRTCLLIRSNMFCWAHFPNLVKVQRWKRCSNILRNNFSVIF